MNAFTASVPPSQEHPLLREKFTELVSLRIGPTLLQKLVELGEANNSNVTKEVRNALVSYVDPQSTPQTEQLPLPVPALTEEQRTLQAFENETIIRAIRSVAKSIEQGSIPCDFDGIVKHFISFGPPQ